MDKADDDDGNNDDEISNYLCLSIQYYEDGQYEEAILNGNKCLQMATENGNWYAEMNACLVIGESELALKQYENAVWHCLTSMEIASKDGDEEIQMKLCSALAESQCALENYEEALTYARMCIDIAKEVVDEACEAKACLMMAETYFILGEYDAVISYGMRALRIGPVTLPGQNEQKYAETKSCLMIAKAYKAVRKYDEAIEYALRCITKETDGKHLEKEACLFLTEAAREKGELKEMEICFLIADAKLEALNYSEAVKYGLICADVAIAVGDKIFEHFACHIISLASRDMTSYDDVIQYAKKRMTMEDRTGDHGNKKIGCLLLGIVDLNLKTYDSAVSYFREAIDHAKKEGDEWGEMCINWNYLGKTHKLLNQLDDAMSCWETSFQIVKKIGNKCCDTSFPNIKNDIKLIEINISLKLSDIYAQLNRNDEAESYATIALKIATDLGDKDFQKTANFFLGHLYSKSSNQQSKAIAYLNEAANIAKETEDYITVLGASSLLPCSTPTDMKKRMLNVIEKLSRQCSLSHTLKLHFSDAILDSIIWLYYDLLMWILQIGPVSLVREALYTSMQIAYGIDLQFPIQSLIHSIETLINTEPMNAENEALTKFLRLGIQVHSSKELLIYLIEIFNLYLDDKDSDSSLSLIYSCIGVFHYMLEDIPNAKASCIEAIKCFESLFDGLQGVDKSKISIVDRYVNTYKLLSKLLIQEGNIEEALLWGERCRAKALKDILVYGLNKKGVQEGPIEVNDILPIVDAQKFCILFYTASFGEIHKFVMEDGKSLHFFSVQPQTYFLDVILKELIQDVYLELDVWYDFSCKCDVRPLPTIAQMRDYSQSEVDKSTEKLNELFKKMIAGGKGENRFTSALEELSHKLLGDVLLLGEDEVVIIPDGMLSIVPFAALTNLTTGRYLSEDKKIRFAPSLTTLKLLSESREDFHALKGAIFIGNPDVGKVLFDGKEKADWDLDDALDEVKKLSNILKVTPMTGEQATKSAVLEKLQGGASVVHIAAHGHLDKATIILAPDPEIRATRTPDEDDYMLTMAEVQQAQVRAQLVVLSCCYSGRGEIRAEGVVGMCRAFLASGARAVVASLWAIDDKAALEFMTIFYLNLQNGESASTSLQMTMKEMREIEEFEDPKYWAPFFLMGDDVKIQF